ncbi:Complement factor H-related protein 4 [Dissostichus eleginoides]|uniref:Complement factor H-related protein 4 n=1 Tax=Dissostichus eleginoides TaxID=100907 RepID=A0AAD9FES4_DISEL|nr:Complement factor H-related protein 4 [Dissostichus eleginoides]
MCVRYLGVFLLVWKVLHDEKACVPLTIPNGNYVASRDGWYEDKDKIRVRCDEGYEHKDRDATAQCINGTWSSVLICERSTESCGDPPKIPHAVIIGKGYLEVFAVNSELQYECEDGYAAEGADTKTIICISGNWTEGPTCIDTCGTPPMVANGDVVKTTGRYLQYQCADQYERVGPKMVECYSDGTWSEAPTCKATYCSVDTDEISQLKSVGVRFITEDEKACVPLTIPNGNYVASRDGWYEDKDKIRVRCDEGYEHKDRDATAQCINGTWSSVPICEIIIGKGYQEVFAVNSELQYECEDGYAAEGADTKTIICISGNWNEGPTCIDTCGTPPMVANGDVVKTTGRYLQYQCADQYERVGPKMVECYSDGTWSEAPTCEATYCSVDTDEIYRLKSVGVRFINDGEKENLECSRLQSVGYKTGECYF